MGIKMLFKYFYVFFLFIFVLKKFYVEANVNSLIEIHVEPMSSVTPPQCNNKSTTNEFKNLKFHLPFADMLFETKYNVRILKDDVTKIIFVIHGQELYQLLVSRESKRLIFLGTLNGSISEATFKDAVIIFSNNYWLLVVAAEEQLEVYQLPLEIIQEQSGANLVFSPIQQITLNGHYKRMFLSAITSEQLMLVITVKFTKLYDQVLTFAWMKSYFDPIEDIDLPPINVVDLIGNNTKYLITGKALNQEQKTILTVYQIQTTSLKLFVRQTLTVNSLHVQAGTFHGRKYLIACAIKQHTNCHTLRWSKGKFSSRKTGSAKDMAFDKISSGVNLLVGVHQNELRIFGNENFDCYHSLLLSNKTAVNELLIHNNVRSEHFIILHYKYAFQSLFRLLEVETLVEMKLSQTYEFEEFDSSTSHQHLFETTIGRLRSMLLRRRYAMEVFRQIRTIVSPKLANVQSSTPIHIENGNIGVLNIVDETLLSPVQILQRIEKMRRRVLEKRIKRSIEDLKSLPKNNNTELPSRMMSLKLQKLKVKNLIYQEKSLADFHMENETDTQPILSITTNVTTKSLNAQQLLTRENYKPYSIKSKNNTTLLKIETLNVERINNITWMEFYDALFLKNRDTEIHGRLIFQSNLKVENLQISLLNGLVVQQLFNLKLPQVIYSDILISAFFVRDLRANKINGLNFAEDIVFSGQDVLIETPVKMHDISIAGDIVFPHNLNLTRSHEIEHLHQFYNGRVIINGSLTLNNINTEHNMTFIWLNGLPVYPAMLQNIYLLKNTTQHFEFPVTFGNAKVTSAALATNFLNDHITEHHLLANSNQELVDPVVLVFLSAEINGNLINSNASASPLLKLNETVVRHGEVANITGFKIFQGPLIIDNVLTLKLNDIPVMDLVLREKLSNVLEFTAAKTFKNILVAGKAFVQEELNATFLNNFKLDELLNYDYYFDSLTVGKRLNLARVIFHKINGISFDDIFTKFNIRNDELVLQKTLIVEGNVTFDEEFNVEFINDINWQTYQASLVLNNEHVNISSEIQFQGPVTVTRDLKANILNNIEVPKMFSHILTKSSEQIISGTYTFGNLSMYNVNVSTINDMSTSNLIDTRASQVVIESDLIMPSLIVNGNVNSALKQNLNFSTLKAQLQDLINMNWDKVVVHGSVTWPESTVDQIQREKVLYLHKHGVRRSSDEQIITGNVHLTRPIIRKMSIKSSLIQGIDLDFMFRDSLFKNSNETQIVLAAKTFIAPVYFRNIEVDNLLNVQILNDIDIKEFNASLYRLSSGQAIEGPLRFHMPPKILNLTIEGTVNGISTAVIYHNSHTPLPALRMRGLTIENTLQINDINEMNFNFFLENRIRKQGPALGVFGHLTFENLIINEKAMLQTINGIPIDILVFKQSDLMQSISGSKHIEGRLIFEGPVHVMRLNDKDIMETYLLSLQTHKNFHFDTLTVDEATFQGGLILPEKQRSMPEHALNSSLYLKPCDLIERESKFAALSRALELVEQTMKKRTNRKIHYLDYDFKTEILWHIPNEAIAETQTIELPCGSMCQRQLLLMQKAVAGNRLYFQNITSSIITATANGMQVETENNCVQIKSYIKINFNNMTLNYELNKYIKSFHIYTFNDNIAYLIVHTIDLHAAHNEVLILKVNLMLLSLEVSQTIAIGIGQQLQFVEAANMSTLILTAFKNKKPTLCIYVFDPQQQQYVFRQFIMDDFDLIATVHHQLILSCRHCQNIYIYAYNNETKLYESKQELALKTFVEQLVVFSLDVNNWYLLVLSKQQKDHYYLYKYAHIQGWLYITHGYFTDTEIVLPLIGQGTEIGSDNKLLLVCSGRAGCNIIRAILK